MKARYKWQPLKQATHFKAEPEALITLVMKEHNMDREEALKLLKERNDLEQYWVNDIYQVQRIDHGGLIQLNIRRRDGGPILRDWRHFQAIKNQLLGEECEAVELYPAESRLTDTANKFHLWGVPDPTFRFPFGFNQREVMYEENNDTPGIRQRPL